MYNYNFSNTLTTVATLPTSSVSFVSLIVYLLGRGELSWDSISLAFVLFKGFSGGALFGFNKKMDSIRSELDTYCSRCSSGCLRPAAIARIISRYKTQNSLS